MSSSGAGRIVIDDVGGTKRKREETTIMSSSSGGAGRIVVDVGGTKFLTATKTLTTNSTYFASLFRGEWSESSAHDGEEYDVFLDQDPVAFGKLLQYMRRGMIKVDDVDIDVLILAEFLGLDRLILAAKVRWYCNIGKGPFSPEQSDEDVAAAFDEVHGGILKAISNGLFPFFLKQDDVNADKDYAVLTVDYDQPGTDEVSVDKIVSDASITSIICGRGGIIGACNGLQADGFMSPGRTLNVDATYTGEELMSFSRRKHSSAILTGNATAIFIPTHDEMDKRRANAAKQFAVYVTNGIGNNVEDSVAYIVAPAEFVGGANETVNEVNNISNPYAEVIIRENLEEDGRDRLYYWLVKHNFTTPETWVLENDRKPNDMFRRWFIDFHSRGFDSKSNIQVFSRPLSLAHQEE